MPQSLSIGAFVFGAVLVLLSLVAGKFEIFGAKVEGTVGKAGRVIAFFFGVFLISTGLNLNNDHPGDQGGGVQNTGYRGTVSPPADQPGAKTEDASISGSGPGTQRQETKPISLTQKFEDYLPGGVWEARAPDPYTGVVVTSRTQFFSNGDFSGTMSGLVNGYPQQQPFSGTWSVRPLAADQFSLTLNYLGAGAQMQSFRVIDHNTTESAANVVVRRISE